MYHCSLEAFTHQKRRAPQHPLFFPKEFASLSIPPLQISLKAHQAAGASLTVLTLGKCMDQQSAAVAQPAVEVQNRPCGQPVAEACSPADRRSHLQGQLKQVTLSQTCHLDFSVNLHLPCP